MVFEFSILQNRKLGNLRNMSVLSNSDSSYNSRFKNDKNMNEQRTETFRYELKEKIKISEISELSMLTYTQDQKLGNLGNFVYLKY